MLPEKTERVWNFLKEQPSLSGFVLIGGSALALRIRHRVSEDLDFATKADRLQSERFESLLHAASMAGHDFQANDDQVALDEFLQGGLELRDYQRDFLVNASVKVSFFTADKSMSNVLIASNDNGPKVASLGELFKTKCLVSAVRSKTRDWLDLYLLLTQHGFTIAQYRQAFIEAGVEYQCHSGLARLCSGTPQRNDEGYLHLLANPPSVEQMKEFFIAQRDKLETDLAANARKLNQ